MARLVVLTGISSPIGGAIAKELLRAGYEICGQYHQHPPELDAEEMRVTLLQADLRTSAGCRALAEHALSLGTPAALINNAALFERSPLQRYERNQSEQMLALNTLAPLELAHHLHGALATHAPGNIINLVDNCSHHRPWPQHSSYAASKAALVAITRALASELAPHIRVNAIGPGLISEAEPKEWTKLKHKIPAARWGQPAEIAEAVRLLLQGPAYLTGQVLTVDGGWSTR